MNKIFYKLNRFFRGKWLLAVLELNKGLWTLKPTNSIIPYLKAENANGRHILLKPDKKVENYYFLIDDLNEAILEYHHKTDKNKWRPGRMVIETSPGNYQVWIHSSCALNNNVKQYWLKKLKSDPGAKPNNRWGRCPGFRNRKEKYSNSKGYYPLSKLVWIDWENEAKIPIPKLFSIQPRGGVCQNINISRLNYERGNESSTDFSYALALIRIGCSNNEIKQRLSDERKNWTNHKGEKRKNLYLDRTINNARKIAEQSHYINNE